MKYFAMVMAAFAVTIVSIAWTATYAITTLDQIDTAGMSEVAVFLHVLVFVGSLIASLASVIFTIWLLAE